MTREEAKIKIGELGMYARTQDWDDEYTEAINMAIKALEQEPCEDCISRQQVKSECADCTDAVEKGISFSKTATNGDVLMTLFPEAKCEVRPYVVVFSFGGCERELPIGWWKASYKGG